MQLSGAILEYFVPAVQRILEIPNRVIVSCIGKSGHIARKIAPTLAFTGTPAVFVHPALASHGYLDMVTKSDICLLISNSGENRKLSDLISYTRRLAIPVIAISGNETSVLICTAA